ncbi:cobalt-precorrin-5B (C(1))-methyltransferase [Ferroplasma acidarmanus]|uniref:Cobalt-precorrin-5B C(1)-methyltransferase n=1 Tax=Ferroplasma acidarmanus Fer1 TaxID=333146 RepID=S0AQM9_FERAC|nr:cobalt-precorrin-5B (C(1))-methyltransferase [Ferroplasma acidarmanus]AGO60345.1 cobalamin biosynthetic protein CbiD [Ferroplasma acidarmanus Fer1]
MYIENPDRTNLRYGYTTGACATAATRAALIMMVTGKTVDYVEINLPAKKTARFLIENSKIYENYCIASVKKDGGDDPDVTTGLYIYSRVEYSEKSGIEITGGEGVGVVTKEGLPIKPGNPAINPVPLKMLRAAATEVLDSYEVHRGLKITISVPGGAEVATKTCNPKLGIIGGISILGTRGIVIPFSDSSWKASIVLGIRVASRMDMDTLVFSTGGRSDTAVHKIFPDFKEEQFIEIGDFLGFSVKRAVDTGIRNLVIAGMPGKISKLADNNMDLHSSKSSVNFDFLASIGKKIGYPDEIISRIRHANTVLNVMEIINYDSIFLDTLKERSIENINKITGNKIKVDIEIIKNEY